MPNLSEALPRYNFLVLPLMCTLLLVVVTPSNAQQRACIAFDDTATPRDRDDPELKGFCGSDVLRVRGNGRNLSWNDACGSQGMKCLHVKDWEGRDWNICNSRASDGSRAAVCYGNAVSSRPSCSDSDSPEATLENIDGNPYLEIINRSSCSWTVSWQALMYHSDRSRWEEQSYGNTILPPGRTHRQRLHHPKATRWRVNNRGSKQN